MEAKQLDVTKISLSELKNLLWDTLEILEATKNNFEILKKELAIRKQKGEIPNE